MTDVWTVRIEAARDAQRRTRYAFVVATIVAVAISVAEFNSTLSWYSQFTDSAPAQSPNQQAVSAPASGSNSATSSLRNQARETVVQEWIKSNRMSVSLLGVNFGMSDAPLLGSLSLAIISLWFYVCIRRENHLIAGILRDVRTEDKVAQQRAFYGITGYLVFTTMSDGDEPIFYLDQPVTHKQFYLRPTIKALIYLPVLTITFIVVSDLVSLCQPSPVRASREALFWVLYSDPNQRWFWQLIIMEAVAIALGAMTFSLCFSIMQFEKATGHLLRRFQYIYQGAWTSTVDSKRLTKHRSMPRFNLKMRPMRRRRI